MDRAPGLSVRLKLTLSYAGFLMVAGALLLAVGYFSLSRGVHPGVIFLVRSHADLLRNFAPIAAIVMAFLLVFGLLGGWILAGRMLAPLTRITDATRMAATGSLAHRIRLPGRRDEFRELAGVAVQIVAGYVEKCLRDRQRSAQFVGGVGRESPLFADMGLQPFEHGVESVGELPELIAAAW